MLSLQLLFCLILQVLSSSKPKSRLEYTDVMCPNLVEDCSLVNFWCTNMGRVFNTVDDTCCCDPSIITYSIVIPKTIEESVNPIINDISSTFEEVQVKVKYYINVFCPKLVSACSKAVLTCTDIQDYYYDANDDYCCCIPDLKPILRLRNSSNVNHKSKRSISDVYCPDVVRDCSSFWFICTQTELIKSEAEDTCCCSSIDDEFMLF